MVENSTRVKANEPEKRNWKGYTESEETDVSRTSLWEDESGLSWDREISAAESAEKQGVLCGYSKEQANAMVKTSNEGSRGLLRLSVGTR